MKKLYTLPAYCIPPPCSFIKLHEPTIQINFQMYNSMLESNSSLTNHENLTYLANASNSLLDWISIEKWIKLMDQRGFTSTTMLDEIHLVFLFTRSLYLESAIRRKWSYAKHDIQQNNLANFLDSISLH